MCALAYMGLAALSSERSVLRMHLTTRAVGRSSRPTLCAWRLGLEIVTPVLAAVFTPGLAAASTPAREEAPPPVPAAVYR